MWTTSLPSRGGFVYNKKMKLWDDPKHPLKKFLSRKEKLLLYKANWQRQKRLQERQKELKLREERIMAIPPPKNYYEHRLALGLESVI